MTLETLLLIASHFAAASIGAGIGALAVALVSINRDSGDLERRPPHHPSSQQGIEP